LQEKIDECRESSRGAREIITLLQERAGVAAIDELRIAIQRSDALRTLTTELDRLTAALTQDGDGLSVADLGAECLGSDLDAVAAKEQTVSGEVQELRNRLMEARENCNTAREAFEAIGGDDRAARAEPDRQAALAEITETAERYVRMRSAIVLLQWAIDRYRREKQAPMLKRAGELFAILTCGSFQTLQLEFDEHDNVQLAGIRKGGGQVPVSGMSSGTADQLYLALRLAAVEDYLDRAEPMPSARWSSTSSRPHRTGCAKSMASARFVPRACWRPLEYPFRTRHECRTDRITVDGQGSSFFASGLLR
jgi:uncharacterized protein YhaN